MEIIVATNNLHKLEEFKRIFEGTNIEILSLNDVNVIVDIEETGETFFENALLKAEYIYSLTKIPTIADDSGLMVDALDGSPGVYSARYGGIGVTNIRQCELLLEELSEVEQIKRTAKFVCAIVFVNKNAVYKYEGVCKGHISEYITDDNGFGYDPIFMVNGKSFATMSKADKDKISHRGEALRDFIKEFKKIYKIK